MTNRTERPKNVENMTDEERIEHYRKERIKREVEKKESLSHLSKSQLASIKRISDAVNDILVSYHNMCHPDFGEIVELDRAFDAFKYQLVQGD